MNWSCWRGIEPATRRLYGDRSTVELQQALEIFDSRGGF